MLQLIPGGFLKAVSEDASPQLGGDLDGQSLYDLVNMVDGTFSGKGTFGAITVPTSTITYYFHSHSSSQWSSPDQLNDGSLETFARTITDNHTHNHNSNNCPGTDLGDISKVEIRVYGYMDIANGAIRLVPVFSGGDGDNHDASLGTSPEWSIWFDITNDSNAPASWSWSDVQNMDGKVIYKPSLSDYKYAAKVEIRVTYEGLVSLAGDLEVGGNLTTEGTGTFGDLVVNGVRLHRKWSFADEESGFHDIRLPIGPWTDAGDILEVSAGEWDDIGVSNVAIVVRSQSLWYMFYDGWTTVVGNPELKIGVATSTDRGVSWTKAGDNPILTAGANYALQLPSVIYDEDENVYRLWANKSKFSDNSDRSTQYFTCDGSDDPKVGANWSAATLCTGLTDFSWGLGVNKMAAGQFYYGNFRDTNNQIVAAYSLNGIAWTIIGTIVSKGAAGKFDDYVCAYASLFWNLGVWYVAYSGHDGSRYQIGMATSSDGKTFTKHWYNGGLVIPTSSPVSSRWPQVVRWEKDYQLYVGYWDGTITSVRKYTKP